MVTACGNFGFVGPEKKNQVEAGYYHNGLSEIPAVFASAKWD